MTEELKKEPVVFISYSHDSPDHNKWVGEFASSLVEKGVDVILDQWDLSFGGDVPRFMQEGVSDSDRVLMICTESYVRKANDGDGGVGFEAMIVTGELVQNVGSTKFIPVVKQGIAEPILPSFLQTKFYVNLGVVEIFEEQLELLLRELHKVPLVSKPPLGKNPFTKTPSGKEASIDKKVDDNLVVSTQTSSSLDCYKRARGIVLSEDLKAWRLEVVNLKSPVDTGLKDWLSKNGGSIPDTKSDMPGFILSYTNIYEKLFSFSLAGVESGSGKFSNQISMVDYFLKPSDWRTSGYTLLIELPEAATFIYHLLHGAVCMLTYQLSLGTTLAKSSVFKNRLSLEESKLIIDNIGLSYLATSFDGTAQVVAFFDDLPENWPWLLEIFGSKSEFKASLCAYCMVLNIMEAAKWSKKSISNSDIDVEKDFRYFNTPTYFYYTDEAILERAYRLLMYNQESVKGIWRDLDVPDDKMKEMWAYWISLLPGEDFHSYRSSLLEKAIHKNLFNDINV